LAATYAEEHRIPLIVFEADWNKHGKRAGFIRNTDIVMESDMIVAFWDGKSRGTADTIAKAKTLKKPTLIIYV
jgi:hypothetical protein